MELGGGHFSTFQVKKAEDLLCYLTTISFPVSTVLRELGYLIYFI
jgi:hypothetical protein